MISKFCLSIIALYCFFNGGFAHETKAGPPKAAPIVASSFLEELQPYSLRVRHLQGDDKTQDIGETFDVCAVGLECKDGLQCRRTSGDSICICGLTCNPGTCQVAPTPAPTPAPAPSLACFSASATVQTADKGIVEMKDLAVGDLVRTEANKFEEVYAFGHQHSTVKATFLQIHTVAQPNPLEVTQDHMLQINGKFSKSSSVKVGDTLQTGEGAPTKVIKVHSVTRHDGVYAPLTPSGRLLVDNVVVSAYVSLQDQGNEYPVFANGRVVPITQQDGIHMLLSPYRMICMGIPLNAFCHSRNDQGISTYVDWGIQLAHYANALNLAMQFSLLTLAVALFVPLYFVECLFGPHYAPLVVFAGIVAVHHIWKKRRQEASQKCKRL